MFAKGRTELRVHVVVARFPVSGGTSHDQFHRPVTQQPYPDIHQEVGVLHQFAQRLYARFLEHVVQSLRCLPVHHEYPVVLGQARVYPKSVAHHIRFRNGLQRLSCTYQNVSAYNHGVQAVGSLLHHLPVEWQLQREQVLGEALSASPAVHRYWGQDFTRGRVGRQAPALSARVQQDTFFTGQPFRSIRGPFVGHTGLQQPGGSSSRTQLVSDGVRGAEPFVPVCVCYIMKTFHQVRILNNEQ